MPIIRSLLLDCPTTPSNTQIIGKLSQDPLFESERWVGGHMNSGKPTQSMTPAELAVRARLGTLTHAEVLIDGDGFFREPAADGTSTASQVEKACDFQATKYFFACRLGGKFGSVGFVYEPSLESKYEGSANPFDTGGVYKGWVAPFKEMNDKTCQESACLLIKETLKSLEEWREDFRRYLADYFPEPEAYLAQTPRPKTPPPANGDPDQLPVRHKSNHESGDFRYCCWEVRLNGQIPITQNLELWGCDRENYQLMKDTVRSDPDHPLAALVAIRPAVVEDPTKMCEQLNEIVRTKMAKGD